MSEGPSRRSVLAAAAMASLPGASAQLGASGPALPELPATDSGGVSIRRWGIRGGNDPADGPRLQKAFDEAPVGGNLLFPPGDYLIRQPLRLTRQMNLLGSGARLVGDFAPGDRAALVEINIEDAANRDNRGQRIEGLRLIAGRGARDALVVRNRAPNVANIGMIIEGNLFSAAAGEGAALRLEGIGTHHLVIRSNQIENGIVLASADGVTIEDNLIFGEKTGITLDLIVGAFQTRIVRNGIVSRDGALAIVNGSQVYFENNQVEQFAGYGANRSAHGAHVTIAPAGYGARHIRIRSNNFGGGDHARAGIHVRGDCQDLLIDDNVFNVHSGPNDIVISDAAVAWTRIGPNNSLRGPTARRPHLAAGSPLAIEDRGLGSFGVRKRVSDFRLAGSWLASSDFAFWKTLDGDLHITGSLRRRAPGADPTVGVLPAGFRPAARTAILAVDPAGSAIGLLAMPDGTILCANPTTALLTIAGTAVPAALRAPYPDSDP